MRRPASRREAEIKPSSTSHRSSAAARPWWSAMTAADPSASASPDRRRLRLPARRRPSRASSAFSTGAFTRACSIAISVVLWRPPPQTIQVAGVCGKCSRARAMEAAVKAVSVAAPSAGDRSSTAAMPKSIRSSDLGGTRAKKAIGQHGGQRNLIDLSAAGKVAIQIHRPRRHGAASSHRSVHCPARYQSPELCHSLI